MNARSNISSRYVDIFSGYLFRDIQRINIMSLNKKTNLLSSLLIIKMRIENERVIEISKSWKTILINPYSIDSKNKKVEYSDKL